MTQQEFETRTGINYAHGEFDDMVNPIYMAAGQMDKDAFCAEFKKHSDYLLNSRIVSHLVAEVEGDREAICSLKRQVEFDAENLQKNIDDFAYTLIDIAEETGSKKAREKAIMLVGLKGFIRRKIERNYDLNKEDRVALLDILD